MEFANKKVLIVGLAKTGEATARFFLGRGARVTVSDKKPETELGRAVADLRSRGAVLETCGHVPDTFLRADLIVPSPGVPDIPELRAARAKGVPVLSEIEIAFRFLKGTIIGITGSNGKSTTTTLAQRILKDAGFRARLVGNIGTPLIGFVEKSRTADVYVTEISSFQLQRTDSFRARVAAFLNISLNHLDWHASFEEYYEAKRKLFATQTAEDTAILNREDALVWSLAKDLPARVLSFSRRRRVRAGCFLEQGWIVLRDGTERRLIRTAEIPIPGGHNQENVMAAALIGHLFEVPAESMRATIRTFRGLEHRLEPVLTVRGVRFVNDSKATTVDATLKALQSFSRTIVLIIGGKDKGGDFGALRRDIRARVRTLVLIGESKDKIRKGLEGAAPIVETGSMKEAVARSFAAARSGDVVLLAPACASFDWFRNYEQRGRVFKSAVRALDKRLRKERP
jgi:UDP-N-acetylmuramoylalanine--D-glutamate ligase